MHMQFDINSVLQTTLLSLSSLLYPIGRKRGSGIVRGKVRSLVGDLANETVSDSISVILPRSTKDNSVDIAARLGLCNSVRA